jgi:hypothetical protein
MLLQPRDGYENGADSGFFLPGLREQANVVSGVTLSAGGGELIGQFTRLDSGWISASPAGFPADWENIRELIESLAEARVSEAKTANPDYYHRLGVRDTSDPEAQGLRVDLASETTQWSAIIGNGADSRQGQFARIPNQPVSVLLDRQIQPSRDPVGWLEQVIVNLPAAEVQSVSISHPGKADIVIAKASREDTDFVLQDVPAGRTARTGFTINGVAGGLANLEMQGARALEGQDFSAATTTRFATFDNRIVSVQLLDDEDYWLRISAVIAPGDDQSDASTDNESGPVEWVATLNSEKSTWAFAIPQYKFETLSRNLEDLLESVED